MWRQLGRLTGDEIQYLEHSENEPSSDIESNVEIVVDSSASSDNRIADQNRKAIHVSQSVEETLDSTETSEQLVSSKDGKR